MAEYQNRNLRIEGLRELNAKLRAAGDDYSDLRDLMELLSNTVIAAADIPEATGELAGTIRAGRGRTKAVVRVGYARRGEYAGVVHYGNPYNGTRAQPFLVEALRVAQPQLIAQIETGIDQILKKNRL